MASIGDLLLKVSADLKGFEAEVVKGAEKAGDKAGQTLGQRLSSSIKADGFKVLSGAASLAFGAMAKRALEAEEAQARYRAETGATVEEAKAAFQAANQIAGQQRQSLGAVTDASISVRKNLGLVGEAADAATADFVEFARVTGQDATRAVQDFDDILDAYQLDAKDARKIQDQLLKSTQKYGGSVTDLQANLAAMAPQLQGLNLGYEDGIELLNLFAASGLDGAAAQKALNSAIKNLPEGETLDEFVKRLASVTDDGERARLAMEVFGARAGAGLANAIRPGIGGLEDFGIAAEDAAGTVDAAAEAIDGTFGARFQRLFSEAGAALRGFGADFGPALSGIGSLITAAGALGVNFGSLFSKIKVPASAKTFGTRLAKAIGGGLSAATDGLASAVASGLDSMPGSSKVKTAIGKARKFLSSALGKGLAITVAVVAVVELVETYNQVKGEIERQSKDIAKQTAGYLQKATTEELINARKGVAEQLAASGNDPVAEFLGLSAAPAIRDTIAQLDDEIARRAGEIPKNAGDAMASNASYMKDAAKDAITTPVQEALAETAIKARIAAGEIPGEIAGGIRDKRSAVDQALEQLKTDMENSMRPSEEKVKLIGVLTSQLLADGLKDGDPVVRAQAQETKRVATERLLELVGASGDIGRKATEALAKAAKDKSPAVRDAAIEIRRTIERNIKPDTKPAATSATSTLAKWIRAGKGQVGLAAAELGRSVVSRILATITGAAGSGFGLFGPKPPKGAATGAIVPAYSPRIVGERRPELFVPTTHGRIYPTVASGLDALGVGQGGDTYNLQVVARDPARTPADIVAELRRNARLGYIGSRREMRG